MLISVVIPCYYSEKTIRKVVELVMAEFEKNDGYVSGKIYSWRMMKIKAR